MSNALTRRYFYKNIPKLGSVAISRHALSQLDAQDISQVDFELVLRDEKNQVEEGRDVVIRSGQGMRIVILLHPQPYKGERLVVSVHKDKPTPHIKFKR